MEKKKAAGRHLCLADAWHRNDIFDDLNEVRTQIQQFVLTKLISSQLLTEFFSSTKNTNHNNLQPFTKQTTNSQTLY